MGNFNTKVLPLSKIKANQQNPRIISEGRLKKLINSLLVFPAMLSLRPIVIDDGNVILGGNMRQTALSRISQLTFDELVAQLEKLPEYNELPDGGAAVREYWEAFLNNPQNGQNPYKMFEGVMRPDGKDENGDLIYVYDEARTI